ncbi:MAG: Gfo/Idh/MocA family oxidoreductase [Actinomycetes bacterium]
MRVGMIGLSEGNGHPFSFSAILNGYDDAALAASAWPGIHAYVRRRDAADFGVAGLQVTHAWTQDPEITRSLCAACRVPHVVDRREDMLDQVDAVIIARDDHETHLELARPFLEAGLHVLIDKPLSLDPEALRFFAPYLEEGRLMSCSGMRYARELDEVRATLADYGRIRLMRGAVVLSWEKYGIHLVDAIYGVTQARPVSVAALEAPHASLAISMDDGSLLQIDALGDVPPTFHFEFFGTARASSHDVTDNFSMFRRMLWHFAQMIGSGRPAVPAADTLGAMRLLIAGRQAMESGRSVRLSEVTL